MPQQNNLPHPSAAESQESKTEGGFRFVVLQHDSPKGRHWDFMLEHEGKLRTWALAQPPDSAGPIPAELLPDHRLAYLEYEGPISGDRGNVHRWDKGTYKKVPYPDLPHEVYLLEGTRLRGRAIFQPCPPPASAWHFDFDSTLPPSD